MNKLLKKSILFIMLLFSCIIFTGCAGNADSYDDSEVCTLKVTVDKNLINSNSEQSANTRASFDLNSLNLYFNGVLFKGHSLDSDSNFVFTNIMYKDKAYEMAQLASRTTILITVGENKNTPTYTVVCKNIINLPTNLHINFNLKNNLLNMTNEGNSVKIYKVNSDIYDSYAELDEIEKVKIEKYKNNLNAKVTFYDAETSKQGVAIDYESCSWKITAFNSNLEPLYSWTKSDNDTSNNLNIQEVNEDTTTYYIISLNSSGISDAKTHNLDNTIVKIDYIKKAGKEIDTNVLNEGTWDYRTR